MRIPVCRLDNVYVERFRRAGSRGRCPRFSTGNKLFDRFVNFGALRGIHANEDVGEVILTIVKVRGTQWDIDEVEGEGKRYRQCKRF